MKQLYLRTGKKTKQLRKYLLSKITAVCEQLKYRSLPPLRVPTPPRWANLEHKAQSQVGLQRL